jgi:hypothetical protein
LLQVRNTSNGSRNTTEASVPRNVCVDNQTCADSVSDIGTASDIYLNQQWASDLILGEEEHLLAAVNQTTLLELFHKQLKFITSPTELDWGGQIHEWIFKADIKLQQRQVFQRILK